MIARLDALPSRTRFLVVSGDYAAAGAAGLLAGWLHDAWLARQPFDTSGGMYAWSVMLTVLGVFLPLALVPTALGLWFLRRHPVIWNTIALGALLFAAGGLGAALRPLVHHAPMGRDPVDLAFELLWLAHMLGVPLWLAAGTAFVFLAPTRAARRMLGAALALEAGVAVCAAIHWLLPRPPL